MRLQNLDSARDDLIKGFYFYEKQEPGLGDYFLASLYSDMEALKLPFGIHPNGVSQFSPSAFEQISVRHLLDTRQGDRSDSRRGGLPPQAVLDSTAP
ncbi:MAG: hypothetical protein WCG66_09100 [bacterium]